MSLAFTPFQLGPLTLKNRLVMAPMQQYRGRADSSATAYHEFHYGRCAEGGVGLIVVESTAVSPNGRLFKDDIGLFVDEHVAPMRRVAEAVHAHGVPILVQLSHGGRKSQPPAGGRLLAPSAVAYDDASPAPEAMSSSDVDDAIGEFVAAALRARDAGFDGVELHAAHGYLLHQFLSPLSNRRGDAYGGSLERRARMLGEVLQAVRAAVGVDFCLTVRVSASDYVEGGLDAAAVSQALCYVKKHGIDAVHVSSGGLLPVAPDSAHPGYQVAWASEIRRLTGLPVIAVGGLHRRALIEQVLADGHADLVAIGRPILERPDFMTDKLATVLFEG